MPDERGHGMDEELRARDLLRKGEIAVREYPGRRTVNVLLARAYWRPCGNSARIWKKVGAEDPFVAPEEFPRSPHRAVYAAGRFVRIDQAERAREKAKPKGPPPAKPKPAEAEAPKPKLPPQLAHTPDPNRQPLFAPRKPAQPTAPRPATQQAMDRTPPRIGQQQPSVSSTGRLRTPMQSSGPRRPQVVEDAPPPPIVPNNAATEYAKAMASARAAQRPTAGDQEARQREIAERQAATRNAMSRGQGAAAEDRPKHGKQRWIEHEAKMRQRAAAKAAAEKAAQASGGGSSGVGAKAGSPPVSGVGAKAPMGASGMFAAAAVKSAMASKSAAQAASQPPPRTSPVAPKAEAARPLHEARAEQARNNAVSAPPALQADRPRAPEPPKPAPPPTEAAGAKTPVQLTKGAVLAEGTILGTPLPAAAPPPGGGQILNQMGPAAVVPRRKPTVVEKVEEDPVTLQPKAPPVDRTPPKPGAGGGMDDFFGAAAQEGRVRLPSRKKPGT